MAFPIDFWFSIGSLYTYLAVMRLPEVEARTGAALPVAAVQRPHHHDRDGQHPGQEAGEARLFVARRGTASRSLRVSISFAAALPAPEFRPRQPDRDRGRRRGLVPGLRARRLSALVPRSRGSGKRAQQRRLSARDRTGCAPGARACRIRRRPPRRTRPPPPKRAASAFSACRHSSAAARSSGATTGWTMPSVGTKSGIEPERNCTATARDVLEKFGARAPQIGGAS